MRQTLVVLGKSWRRRPFGLSLESRMNALAGAELLQTGAVDRIVFSGGQTAGPEHPSEARAMREYLRRHAPALPDAAFLLEEEAIDTAANAEKVHALLPPSPILLLTTSAHRPAAAILFRRYRVQVARTLAAEDLLRNRSPHHARFVARYRRSPAHGFTRLVELIRRAWLLVDRRGKLLRPVTRALRR